MAETYEIKLLQSEEGYAVWCPALPGCWSQGATEEEAIENIRDAIAEYLADVEEESSQITRASSPPPSPRR
jgi:predicted RNase H-like HicB family nuclease